MRPADETLPERSAAVGSAGGPDADRIRPHVLWLPHDQPQVLDYFARVREILTPYEDIITPRSPNPTST